MSRRFGRRATVVVVSVLAITLAVASAGVASRFHWTRSLDLSSVALPQEAIPQVQDAAVKVDWTRAWRLQADTASTGSAECDGCSADAKTLQVLYVGWARSTELNNVSTAWSATCSDCRSTALSVQVVIARTGSKLVANNRAFAANASCDGCGSNSAAYQLVVVTDHVQRLSREEMAQLRAWVDEQAQALRGESELGAAPDTARRSPTAPASPAPAKDLSAVEDVVTGAVGGTTLVSDADLSGP
jgi:hypothetical protein